MWDRVLSLLVLCITYSAVSQQQSLQPTNIEVQYDGDYTGVNIYADSNVKSLAMISCRDSVFESCIEMAEAAIQLEKNVQFGHLLVNWKYSDICG
jgi:hypothetical protein